MGRGRVKLTEVNPHLVCVLCRGYLIDATTITECLHSFCRSCIILYLETKSYCPICEVQIHKTKPYLNLKLDKTLQDIVYKLVPGLFHNEMRRRQEFYKSHPLHDRHLHPESRGIAIDRLIYSPDDSISLSLEYYDKQREQEEWTSVGDTNAVATHGAEGKRYLLCPAVFTMANIKKFLRSKYNLPETSSVEVLYRRESLPDSYSLMDVAYIYTWKQSEPMRFYYRIHVLQKYIRSLPELKTVEKCDVDEEASAKTTKNNVNEQISKVLPTNNVVKPLHLRVPANNMVSKYDKTPRGKEYISSNTTKDHARKGSTNITLDESSKHQKDSGKCKQLSTNGVSSVEGTVELCVSGDLKPKAANGLNHLTTLTTSQDKQSTTLPNKELLLDRSEENSKDKKPLSKSTYNETNEKSSLMCNDVGNNKSQMDVQPIRHSTLKDSPSVKNENSELMKCNQSVIGRPASISQNDSSNNPKLPLQRSLNTADSPTGPLSMKIKIDVSKSVGRPVNNGQMRSNGGVFNSTPTQIKSKFTNGLKLGSSGIRPPDTIENKTSSQMLNSNVKPTRPLASRPPRPPSASLDSESKKRLQTGNPGENNKKPSDSNISLKTGEKTGNPGGNNKKPCDSNISLTTGDKNKSDNSPYTNLSSRFVDQTEHKSPVTTTHSVCENSEDITAEVPVVLDESSAALLSAIGLQPKSKTSPVKPNETVKDISPEKQTQEEKLKSCKIGVPKNETSAVQEQNLSEHDESVSLLLGLRNGHRNRTDQGQNAFVDCNAAPTISSLKPENSKSFIPVSTTANSPIKNMQKVVNNIVPPTKSPFKTPISVRDKKTEHTIKNVLSNDKNKLPQINGFKVPHVPSTCENKTQFNGGRLCHSPRPFPVKQPNNVINKTEEFVRKDINNKYLTANDTNLNKQGYRNSIHQPYSLKIPNPKQTSSETGKALNQPMKMTSLLHKENSRARSMEKYPSKNSENASKTQFLESSLKSNGDINSRLLPGYGKVGLKTEHKTEITKKETRVSSVKTGVTDPSTLKSSSPDITKSETTESSSESKVNMLKRKLNVQQNECDVVVSAATRDDGISEAKRRRQVTPDVSIELLSGSPNERGSVKRPLFEYPSLTKKQCTENKITSSPDGSHIEMRISKVDQLCASTVKIEKIQSPSHVNNSNSKASTIKDKHPILSNAISGTAELRRCGTPKCDENKNGDDMTPDITIEKMMESSKIPGKRVTASPENDCELNVSKIADISNGNSISSNKRQTESPSSSISDSESPQGGKKIPRLIEINAPPRPKLDPTFQERKNQRTGLKMTTVRKEVPIGKEVPMVRKDSNGALDLSGRGIVGKQSSSRPPTLISPTEMFPSALHQFFRHQLELQGRLLASHANNNLGHDWQKNPLSNKHFEDWVRNAVSCGALPPHPLLFNPSPAPTSPHRK